MSPPKPSSILNQAGPAQEPCPNTQAEGKGPKEQDKPCPKEESKCFENGSTHFHSVGNLTREMPWEDVIIRAPRLAHLVKIEPGTCHLGLGPLGPEPKWKPHWYAPHTDLLQQMQNEHEHTSMCMTIPFCLSKIC